MECGAFRKKLTKMDPIRMWKKYFGLKTANVEHVSKSDILEI